MQEDPAQMRAAYHLQRPRSPPTVEAVTSNAVDSVIVIPFDPQPPNPPAPTGPGSCHTAPTRPAAWSAAAGSPRPENPHRLGKPLVGQPRGYHSARRGAYRVIYRIDDTAHVVHVVRIDHRADIYRT